jgi:hypothetical protein
MSHRQVTAHSTRRASRQPSSDDLERYYDKVIIHSKHSITDQSNRLDSGQLLTWLAMSELRIKQSQFNAILLLYTLREFITLFMLMTRHLVRRVPAASRHSSPLATEQSQLRDETDNGHRSNS